jgi:hypothetical protein
MDPMRNAHSAEGLPDLSMLVHNRMGWLIPAIAATTVVAVVRGDPADRWRYGWVAAAHLAGYGLVAFFLADWSIVHRMSLLAVPTLGQHLVIGLVVGARASVEGLRRRDIPTRRWAAMAWPLALPNHGGP